MTSGIGGIGAGGQDPFASLQNLKGFGADRSSAVKATTDDGTSTESVKPSGFSDLLAGKLQDLNASQADSDLAMQELATGSIDDVAQTMMRIEQANVSLRMATQVRNKVIEAYQEVIRMQI